MSKIEVHCSYTKLVDVGKVKPNPRNPNKHPAFQVEKMAVALKTVGWRAPITVSKRSGMVVRGHCRLMAAKKLGMKQVPVDIQPYVNEQQEWFDLLNDNFAHELGEMDLGLSGDMIRDLSPDLQKMLALSGDDLATALGGQPEEKPKGEFVTFRCTQEQAAIVQQAIEKVKEMEGKKISDGRCLELISGDFMGQ